MKALIFILNLIFGLLWIVKGITTSNDGSVALGTISLVIVLILFAFIQAERKI